MGVIYGLIPGMILMGIVAVGIMFWASRSGQYDDMDGEAHRILMDEDLDVDFNDQPAAPEEVEAVASAAAETTEASKNNG